ncbi:MAG: nuclear transport factor 2 family protein [Desulfarculaceae bacterium]|nr:nuclear transport factor 2 family protein [Desulfarculaceae bacterium]MCF8047522.1 nuclear transport factor 2 family protein [Desulfarculaceae bacterium]MCF8065044.1 nuclear transport factor 2 family protein [Desulfarculaceae bacterium]MCF8097925.1 nuclear transport factor 2 family protein [Desulfarculaceae bacterium]MCF8120831.1 nuclear transport factor 2 family protein [Desulfarculaceae bacterium]
MKKFLMIALSVGMLLSAGLAQAGQSQGEKLVRDLWALFAAKDQAKIEAMTSPAFQSVRSIGAYGKAKQMKLTAGLDLGPYTLSNFKVTEQGPVIVATYTVSVAETINGQRLDKKPAPRMSVFIKTDQGWQWLAHANLKPVK